MKKILLLLAVTFSASFLMKANAQNSCPIITNFQILSMGPGTWQVKFNYENPTSGNKWVSVEVLCNATQALAPTGLNCFKVPTDGSAPLYTSATFACANLAGMTVYVRSHTGNDCGGTVCQVQFSIGGSPLPVNFKSFDATRNNSNVNLTWTTSTEVNNKGFEIQRRTGLGNWQLVSFIPTKAFDGNSQSDLTYSYTEVNTLSGATQYRIRQIDIDGHEKYSDVRSVRGEGQFGKVIIFPNPSNDGKIKMIFEDTRHQRDIMVTDMSGRMVKLMKSVSTGSVEIDNLAPGMYSIKIVDNETFEQALEKVIVNKR